jgi:hypothetical protein
MEVKTLALAPFRQKELDDLISEEADRIEALADRAIAAGRKQIGFMNAFRIDLIPNPANTLPQVQYKVVCRYKNAGWRSVSFEQRSTVLNEEIYQLVLEQGNEKKKE